MNEKKMQSVLGSDAILPLILSHLEVALTPRLLRTVGSHEYYSKLRTTATAAEASRAVCHHWRDHASRVVGRSKIRQALATSIVDVARLRMSKAVDASTPRALHTKPLPSERATWIQQCCHHGFSWTMSDSSLQDGLQWLASRRYREDVWAGEPIPAGPLIIFTAAASVRPTVAAASRVLAGMVIQTMPSPGAASLIDFFNDVEADALVVAAYEHFSRCEAGVQRRIFRPDRFRADGNDDDDDDDDDDEESAEETAPDGTDPPRGASFLSNRVFAGAVLMDAHEYAWRMYMPMCMYMVMDGARIHAWRLRRDSLFTCTHACILTYAHTHIRTYSRTHVLTHVHTRIQVCVATAPRRLVHTVPEDAYRPSARSHRCSRR